MQFEVVWFKYLIIKTLPLRLIPRKGEQKRMSNYVDREMKKYKYISKCNTYIMFYEDEIYLKLW